VATPVYRTHHLRKQLRGGIVPRFALAFLLSIFYFPVSALAQFTIVTGTVTDVNGVPYVGGTISASLVTPGGTSPTLNGLGFTGSMSPIGLDATGSFTARLADNNVILPSGTQWKFLVNHTGAPPPLGTGPQTCTATLTITGASQSVSASFAACPFLGRVNIGNLDTIKDGLDYSRTPNGEGPIPLISNGNFEQASPGYFGRNTMPPPGWFPDAAVTASYETVAPCEGNRSLKIVYPGLVGGNEVTANFFTPAQPGDVFYLSGIIKTDGVLTGQLRMNFLDKNNLGIGVDPAASTTSTSCTPVSVTGTAPAGTVYVMVRLAYLPNSTPGTVWYDAINLYKVNYPGGLQAPNVTVSALTSGNCVQATAGGLLTSTASPCGGGFTSVTATPVTVNAAVTTDQNLMAITIPAGTMNLLNHTLLVQLAGVYSTPAASTAVLTHKLKLCAVSGCGSGSVLTLATWATSALGGIQATNNPYSATINATTQTAGAAAAFESHGNLTIDISALASAAEAVFADNNTATVGTIDSTAQLFLQHTVAFSAASASNSATDRQMIADTVN